MEKKLGATGGNTNKKKKRKRGTESVKFSRSHHRGSIMELNGQNSNREV